MMFVDDAGGTGVRPRAVGVNHVALVVGDIGEALDFYGAIFEFTLRNRYERMAWIDLGDQFIALAAGTTRPGSEHVHFGLVVDDKEAARRAVGAAGVEALPGSGLRFRDPWGNLVEIVDYREIQFAKAAPALSGMALDHLEKTPEAIEELSAKGLAGDAQS